MKRILLLCVFLMMMLPATAHAHGSFNTSDYDDDGDARIEFYRGASFGKNFGKGMDALRDTHRRYDNAPRWVRVNNIDSAELIIRYSPPDDFFANTYFCGNSAYINVYGYQDVMNLDPQCTDYKIPVMHEGGHLLGMYHHTCPQDQSFTVMVPSCITLNYWGSHDWAYFSQLPKGV